MARAAKSPTLDVEAIGIETDEKEEWNEHVEKGTPSVALEATGTVSPFLRICLYATATS